MLIPLLLPQEIADIIVLDGVSLDLENGVSNLVREQIPDFIASEHGQFVEFLKQYYEWMEFETNPKYESNQLIKYRDVDLTSESLLKRFTSEFANGIPELLAFEGTNKRKMIKGIIDLYRAKGTEKSLKTFFRLLFGEDPLLYYPSNDILKLSSGVWKQPSVIKTSRTIPISSVPDLVGRRVFQNGPRVNTIQAYAFVEKAEVQLRYDAEILELEVSGVFGEFDSERDIILTFGDGSTAAETIIPVIGNIGISSGGYGYEVGNEISVSGSSYGNGAKLYVSTVGPSGDIRGVQVSDSGAFYRKEDTLSSMILNNGVGTGGMIEVSGGASIRETSGFWEGGDGILSGTNRIQDNNYYQGFSYVVRSTKNIEEYKESLKKMVHPAGFKQFGEFLLEDSLSISADSSKFTNFAEVPIIGHYTPYRCFTIRNLRANGEGGSGGLDLYPGGYGWSAAQGNTYLPEESVFLPSFPVGSSGPLGGTTHVQESIGICGASEGPGGTLNAVQGSQWTVVDGGLSSGTTGGDWWVIYPHLNSRDIRSMPFVAEHPVYRLEVSNNRTTAKGDPDPGFVVGEIARQVSPNTQQAVGKITAKNVIQQKNYVDIAVYSGSFVDTLTDVIGGSAGFLEGISSGVTAYINSTDNDYGSITAENELGAIQVKHAFFDLESPFGQFL